jgi:hypothetical protein
MRNARRTQPPRTLHPRRISLVGARHAVPACPDAVRGTNAWQGFPVHLDRVVFGDSGPKPIRTSASGSPVESRDPKPGTACRAPTKTNLAGFVANARERIRTLRVSSR